MAESKVPTKRIKKDIKTLRKGLAAEKKKTATVSKRVTSKTAALNSEMDKLKADVEKLAKKKTPKKQLSEYNLFMRRQLNDGKTFARAVQLWKSYKKGRPLVKTKVVRKTVVRRIAAKPRVITKTRIIRAKPKIITRTRTIVRKGPVRTVVRTIRVPLASASSRLSETQVFETIISQLKKSEVEKMALSDEELAVRLVSLYFEEIARMGFKRQLELDDVINAYYHALTKLKGKKTETTTTVVVQSQPVVVENKQ